MDRKLRLHEHSRMRWCLTKNYCPIASPNLRPAQLSTEVTPAENVIICLEKKVFWFGLWTWIVDRDYMSIPRCYDIPKKFLSNCTMIVIRYHMGPLEPLCGSVNMIWGKCSSLPIRVPSVRGTR